MASDTKQEASSCLNDPNFAIICAFLTKFASKLNVTHPNFQDLQKMLEDTEDGKVFFAMCDEVRALRECVLHVFMYVEWVFIF